jgi:hypothetical protein
MAGDWIKMRSNLQTHPKVARIASASNADRLRVVGGLHAVWCLFDEHSADGHLCGYTPSAVDSLIGWPGFTDLLVAVGWVEWDGNDGLTLPEFDTHNGASAKRRAQENDRKKAERAAALDASKEHPQPDLIPSASHADKKRTREEKRREEKKTEPNGSVERASRKCPESFVVTDDMRQWAAIECPGVNVDRETEKLRDHTFKTARSNWPGVWRNWLREAFDRLPKRSGPAAPQSFAASDREAGMQRWEQMTGQRHPDRSPSDVIDSPATPANLRIAA